MLSYSYWKTHYAGDAGVVGKRIEIARHQGTVIGVAPKGFMGAMPGLRQDVWVTLDPLGTGGWRITHRGAYWLNVVGRLRPGVSREHGDRRILTPSCGASWRLIRTIIWA